MKIFLIIIKSFLGITFMIATVTIGVMLFMSIDEYGDKLIKKGGITETEKVLGGQIIKVFNNDNYKLRIHKPVFAGIFKERKKGFIQIDWFSNDPLPRYINEEFDYDNDGKKDFKIELDTVNNKALITAYSENVINIMDKASINSMILKAYDDARRGVFVYHDYKEARFLGYPFGYFKDLVSVKNIIVLEDRNKFNNYINDIAKGNKVNAIEVSIIDKLNNKSEKVNVTYQKVKIQGKTKHKVFFSVIDEKVNQELTVLTSARDINKDFTAYPKTSYKEGRIVRVMLRK